MAHPTSSEILVRDLPLVTRRSFRAVISTIASTEFVPPTSPAP